VDRVAADSDRQGEAAILLRLLVQKFGLDAADAHRPRIEQVDKRFQQVDKRFDDMLKRHDRHFLWLVGFIATSAGLLFAAIRYL